MHICARGIDFASISTIFLFIFFFDLYRKDVQILIICFNLCSHCRYRYVHANPCFSQFLSLYFCILVLWVCQRSRPGDCFSRDILFCLTPPLFFLMLEVWKGCHGWSVNNLPFWSVWVHLLVVYFWLLLLNR